MTTNQHFPTGLLTTDMITSLEAILTSSSTQVTTLIFLVQSGSTWSLTASSKLHIIYCIRFITEHRQFVTTVRFDFGRHPKFTSGWDLLLAFALNNVLPRTVWRKLVNLSLKKYIN